MVSQTLEEVNLKYTQSFKLLMIKEKKSREKIWF